MAAPAFGASGTAKNGSTTSTVSLDVPDGVVADSLVIAVMFCDGAADRNPTLAGWTEAENSPVLTTDHALHVLYHRATGTESTGGTYDFVLDSGTYNEGQAHRYDGVIASGTPFDAGTNSAVSNTGTSTSPAVTITTAGADRLLIHTATNWTGGTWTAPSGYTKRQQNGDGIATTSDLAQAVAGTSGSVTATTTGTGRSTAWLGALVPVGGAAGGSTARQAQPIALTSAVQRALW